MTLVDTSLWVEFLRKRGDFQVKQTVARLIDTERAVVTCPIRFELLAGVRPDEEADLEQALAFSVHLPFEPDDWRAAAFLERTLRAEGLTIPRNDIFVATVAIRANLSVTCRDTHFNAIAEAAHTTLRVEQV